MSLFKAKHKMLVRRGMVYVSNSRDKKRDGRVAKAIKSPVSIKDVELVELEKKKLKNCGDTLSVMAKEKRKGKEKPLNFVRYG